ncbi:MAG: PD40 domain-containing protein [Planctomycetes bacterium]|nr:PD40 domain-containing protein [Planctomycetota bacterium]
MLRVTGAIALTLFAASIDAADLSRLTHDGRSKRDPVFVGSSGKSLIYSQLEKPTQLRLMRLSLPDGSPEPCHPSETRSEFEAAPSTDGRYLAFVQNRGNLSLALVIEDLQQASPTAEVPPGGGFSGMHSPTFSPDGSRILFSYPEDGRQQLFAVDIQGKNRHTVVDSVGINNWPSFSPDGKQLVFSSSRDNDFEIYVAKPDGTEPRRLTESPRQDIRPRFSPDGTRIAFTSNRDGNYEIYVMNPDGTNLHRVTNNPEQDDYPSWHPDGKQLVVVSERRGQFDLYLIEAP